MSRAEPAADRDIMRLVAELYYERALNQPEIADLTGFSISKVSRLLTAARDQGVVRITVEAPQAGRTAAAEALATRFGVQVELTPGGAGDDAAASRLAGLAAADHLAPRLPHEGTVGIAAGYTVAALVSALPAIGRPGLTIVPVVGGWDIQNQLFDGNELARRMAERFGARARSLHAPAVLDSPATKEALLKDSAIGSVAAEWNALDVAVLGIGGAPYAHPGYRTAIDRLDAEARTELAELDVVGDIACHFLGRAGTFLESWSARTLAIPIEALRRVPLVFAVAAGPSKAPAILAALRSGIVRVLVTDAATAAAVAKLAG
ncbi:MAG TPA: sugar-binding domain-containing protein [Candidatus Limnocylindrales bacterium]|nr:sugar-binding domain-containing protein [Candidatus Limnocylindrales bacterium]